MIRVPNPESVMAVGNVTLWELSSKVPSTLPCAFMFVSKMDTVDTKQKLTEVLGRINYNQRKCHILSFSVIFFFPPWRFLERVANPKPEIWYNIREGSRLYSHSGGLLYWHCGQSGWQWGWGEASWSPPLPRLHFPAGYRAGQIVWQLPPAPLHCLDTQTEQEGK